MPINESPKLENYLCFFGIVSAGTNKKKWVSLKSEFFRGFLLVFQENKAVMMKLIVFN